MVFPLISPRIEKGLRPLNPGRDLGQLADLIENAFGDELSVDGARVLRDLRFLAWLGPLNFFATGAQSEDEGIFTGFVWVQDGRVVGNVTVNRPSGHARRWQISNVAVLEGYRRQGIARQLVEAAIELILERGGDVAYLYVREDNPAAQHLYQGLGFVEVDRSTDLELFDYPQVQPQAPAYLRALASQEGAQLSNLVSEAEGAGNRWLYEIRRSQYVWSADERAFRWLESLLTGEVETQWGIGEDGCILDAGVVLCARYGLNRKSHRLKLWIRPALRGEIEDCLIQDVLAVLAHKPKRSVQVTLPAVESAAIEALIQHGFHKHRTLILMRMNV
ncbi:MAG: GNAT family N-acetyltransferase [Anaerolineae bacterium]|nr:GNAT family N-acetyltransferase [Anaerolineae bacterium]